MCYQNLIILTKLNTVFRPSLVHDVIDEYCQARRTLVTRSFLDALTLGGPGGTPRPIELHAHDPQRYVGDMLAYLHQATPTGMGQY